ncbi:AAA family ATPase [Paenibacillus macquariensis]|uniref:ATP-dependent metalloprotease FtsH n=1 Tax=Paenibacillus macquariensis TaxID=948756 RepID=A0ABY1JJF7_9BACL|nr:AAA family ATPase [Paenibacillus macquariensis]MEC0089717.1 AAA family ATPase [Paenibacillus macquariensis]OAB30804.1 ATPase [Paenibacillus macquariensis subsp. macquariensis]SIQ29495.1 ATP-dependent metalloprotease FtsH [Paenibacillus macquariensis]
MPKLMKEILIGLVPVVLIFLAYIGVNMIPFLLVAGVVAVFLIVLKMRGGIAVGASTDRKRKKKGPSKLTFDEIGGQEHPKEELMEALNFLIRHEEIQKYGIRPLKGILLTGPPGTGKTLLARAASHYTDSVFVAASGSEFVEMYVGVGAGRVRDLFRDARTRAQKENKQSAIIFIDEIDVIGGKREGGQQREYDQTLNQLLTEMDGIYNSDSPRILLIAATNRKEMLDSALLRPGRFDRHIQVDLPEKKGRKHILEIYAKNKPIHTDANMDKIAEESYGFSGAQLESVMNEAAIYMMRENKVEIEQRHMSMAIDKVMMGEKTDRESTQEEKKRVAIHELGHAIMAEIVRPGSVSQVALTPRGQALGYVRHNPQEEQYLYTKAFLEEQIMIALGGAASEEIYYGGRSTGSSNDFEQALNIVQTMMKSGLTSLGIINIDMVTTEELMKVNNVILEQLMTRTRSTLEQHRHIFDHSLEILLTEENLSGEQFRCLFRETSLLPA